MAEEDQGVSARGAGDAAALGVAMNADPSAVEDARAYLREQTRLARLQSENLVEQNAFELSHLRWRRVTDRIRGAGYAILTLAGFALVAVVCAAMWSAAHDNGLVVESFSVPGDLAARGQSGAVVAQHVLDRIAALQADTISLRAAHTYTNNWGDDLRVQIPDTGVSLGEAYRYLTHWLGHQTHISGEIVHSGNGLALTARAGAAPGRTFAGIDLDALVDRTAESIFAQTQPYRYGIYLFSHGRNPEARTVLLALAQSGAPASERAWAYAGLIYGSAGDPSSERYGRAAIALNPDLMLAHNNLAAVASRLGHSELAWREASIAARLAESGAGGEIDPRAAGIQKRTMAEEADANLGDYQSAINEMRAELATDWSTFRGRSQAFLVRDLAATHDTAAARALLSSIPPVPGANASAVRGQILVRGEALAQIDMAASDWASAKTDLEAGIRALHDANLSLPLKAYLPLMQAKTGDIAGARWQGATLPPTAMPVSNPALVSKPKRTTGRVPKCCTRKRCVRRRRFLSPMRIGARCCLQRATTTRRSGSLRWRTRKDRTSLTRWRCGAKR